MNSKISAALLGSLLLASSGFVYAAAAATKNIAVENNTTADYLVLNSTTSGGSSKGYCSAGTQGANCLPSLAPTPPGQQWVLLPNADSWIALNYNVCSSMSGNSCSGYLANITVTFNSQGATVSGSPDYKIGPAINGVYHLEAIENKAKNATPKPM